jgi:hypothetical protein
MGPVYTLVMLAVEAAPPLVFPTAYRMVAPLVLSVAVMVSCPLMLVLEGVITGGVA